ncbi:MAG: DNA gyrase subunit A, partial [Desulfofustis sp.]|nr:DNA gyrase subunit A [Desulfofustis sp.]
LKELLADENLIMALIKSEFYEIKETYGDQRRTEIIDAVDEILPEDLISPELMAVTVTHTGYIKRNPVSLYRSQGRGGKGVRGVTNIEEDFVSHIYVASTLDTFLFFTNYGKVFWRKVYQLPLVGRSARGKAIVNLLELTEGEKVAAILPISSFEDDNGSKSILMITRYGRVKKTALIEFNRPLRKGKRALTINEGDEIIAAHVLNGNDTIFMISQRGMSIHFQETDIREMGRTAAGVKGISLKAGDFLVGANVLEEGSEKTILTVTANGYGKRSSASDYRIQKRGGKGILAIRPSERNGDIIGTQTVDDHQEVILIADSGKMIRMPATDMRVIGRTTQGVRLINLETGERVVGMDVVEPEPEDDEEQIIE